VGSSLCGGRAYALLEQFFREVAALAVTPFEKIIDTANNLPYKTINTSYNPPDMKSGMMRNEALQKGSFYAQMNALAGLPLDDALDINTLFCGTRSNPSLRGSITGIGERNLTPAHLVQGVLRGMADELLGYYPAMRARMRKPPAALIGSGNGIRKNAPLRQLFEKLLGMPMKVPAHMEEAAYGAALFAAAACGLRASVPDAQRVIRYL
jgi:sedoheptulokinase